jgi:hypothetical protein
MATYYSQGSAAFSSLTNWDTNRVGGDTDPASANEAGMAGHTFVIQEGHAIEYDMDMSAWSGTTGLYALTIEGSAAGTPGTLYCKHSGDGTYWLKIQGGSATLNIISGTDTTILGRLLANSDGVWANSTALPNGRKFVIEFMGTTAGKLIDRYLDVKLLCTQPTNTFVHVYGTRFTFNASTDVVAATDVITLNAAAPADGTDVVLVPAAGATLPTGLFADPARVYYVRASSGNTCKLATTNADATIVDITAVGSNHTINVLTEPSSGAGTDTLNVLEDVTADSPWSATAEYNRAVLVDAGAPSEYDQQRVTISTVTDADTLVISATIDSAQFAGCRLFLSSRNISIQSNSTTAAQPIVDSVNTSRGTGNIYQCEITNLAGSATTFYGSGIFSGSGHTISGTVSGCSNGINGGSGHTISGTVSGCTSGIFSGYGHTISGTVSGCINGIAYSYGSTISGTVSGCGSGVFSGYGSTISGTVSGCSGGINGGSGHTISGTVSGCGSGINASYGSTISGTVSGCTSGIYYGYGHTISGTVSGCTYSFRDSVGYVTVKRGASVTYSFLARNGIGQKIRIAAEDHGGTSDAAKVYDNVGDIIRTACDGATAHYPDEDPDEGSGYAIEASNLQSNLSAIDPLYLISDRSPHRVWLAADTWTITYKVYSTFNIDDNNLVLEATYLSAAVPRTITVGTDSQAITAKTGDTDWTQTLSITITTAAAGWVDLDIYLKQYSAGGAVFIWPAPTITAS